MNTIPSPQKDSYVWGSETILWGSSLDHKYTYKLLLPNVGKSGCLSLQSHKYKSETWLVTKGLVWAVVISDWKVTSMVLKEGDFLNLEAGTIHRLMGITEGCTVAEASTPDRHAADKSIKKDVIRWHCVFGRECVTPTTEFDKELIEVAVSMTDRAIFQIDKGQLPTPENYQLTYF
jgi:mannose-6-phosphate isomerase-like protein (cupin superfamily)